MDEELAAEEALAKMKEKESAEKKRQKRRENEKRQKEIVRQQLNMGTPMEIGMEQEGDSMFRLKNVEKAGDSALKQISKGKMNIVVEEDKDDKDFDMGDVPEFDASDDEEKDMLERELDAQYDQYTEMKIQRDAKFKAKRARQELDDGDWTGFSDREESDDENVVMHDQSDDSDDEEEEEGPSSLTKKMDGADVKTDSGLTKRAAMFFDQDLFAEVSEDDGEEEEEEEDAEAEETFQGFSDDEDVDMEDAIPKADDGFETEDEDGFEVVKTPKGKGEAAWNADDEPMKNGRPGKKLFFHRIPCFQLTLLPHNRHRHHHRRGHDSRSTARFRRKVHLRSCRRQFQQVLFPRS